MLSTHLSLIQSLLVGRASPEKSWITASKRHLAGGCGRSGRGITSSDSEPTVLRAITSAGRCVLKVHRLILLGRVMF